MFISLLFAFFNRTHGENIHSCTTKFGENGTREQNVSKRCCKLGELAYANGTGEFLLSR